MDIHAADGEIVGVVGPNGSGKSSLLALLYGALKPSRGSVEIGGEPLTDLSAAERARRVAVVAQNTDMHLPLSVAEVVNLGRLAHRTSARVNEQAVTQALEAVNLLDRARDSVLDLSGGERQRVAIARGLAQQARSMLLDEPTNHLDVRHQHEVMSTIRRLPCAVVVLHDLNLAARYCDRIVALDGGRVVAQGTPHEVLVPQVIEPVYRVRVDVREFADAPDLAFSLPDTPARRATD
ncbi:ABC transporter ATP-binding protein [Corynebacterium tapiri]|uniref:ABC transporter ATP-binding protein n=1 Tax=Corynebacterium tapiri TaxID=1448266 RepID=UPI001FE57C3E|nr:ABC transporter ATP-binding protein [Corynebacterium tapiri]